MKKIIDYLKKNRLFSISLIVCVVVLCIIVMISISSNNYISPDKSTTDDAENQEQDVFEKLNHLTDKDADEFNQISLEGKSAEYFKEKNVNCPSLSSAFYATNDKFVAYENGKYIIYEYNLEKKFSNELNCKLLFELDKNIKLITYDFAWRDRYSFATDYFIIYDDLTYALLKQPLEYCGEEKGGNISCSDCYTTPSVRENYKWSKDIDTAKIPNVLQRGGELTIGKYSVVFLDRSVGSPEIPEILIELTIDVPILKYFDSIVITKKDVYMPGIVDYSCFEYADKDCKKGYKINEDLTGHINDIMFVNSAYIVFNDGTTYYYRLF